MSESNIQDKLLEDYDNEDDEELDSSQIQKDYNMLFADDAKQYYNLPNNPLPQQQPNPREQQANQKDLYVSFKNLETNEDQQVLSSSAQQNQQKVAYISSVSSPTNLPSILKKKLSYEYNQNQHLGQGGQDKQNSSRNGEGENKFIDQNDRNSPRFITVFEDQDKNNISGQNQVRFGHTEERRFSTREEVVRNDRVESINEKDNQIGDESVFQGDPGSVDEEEPSKRSDIDYWKGELPLDLFLESTYENGQRTNLDPLTVYRPEVDPKLYQSRNIESYLHFDEKQYDYQTSFKEGRKRNMLRKINENDGYLGFYSQNKKHDVLKMLVCVTMYSESREFLENTLYHIYQNQKEFVNIGLKDFQICVVVIQDGIMKMKEETVDFYSEIEGENTDSKRNLKIRRYEIQRQIDYFKFKKQDSVIDSNEGLPPTIPKRIALTYQNRLYFIKQDENDSQEKPIVRSSNCRGYNINQEGMTVFSVFKHKNAKKLSSHMWFFEGFCRQFNPKYCALVDVGTLPARDGLLKFYMAMEGDRRIGGVCGFLGLEDPPEYEINNKKEIEANLQLEHELKQKQLELEGKTNWWKLWQNQQKAQKSTQNDTQLNTNEEIDEEKEKLLQRKFDHFTQKKRNTQIFSFIFFLPFQLVFLILYGLYFIIVNCLFKGIYKALKWMSLNYLTGLASLKKAQLYEYTMAHMLDKNFESLLGFLHVLPGAWSAYRYSALEIKYSQRQNLLQKRYFKQLINPDQLEGNIQEANMFLAEDRILCLGIYCQPDSNFNLKYIPDAQAFTDPVDTLEEFMNQRRRWINSTLYALDYVLKHYEHHVKESSHTDFQKNVLLPFNMIFASIGKFNTYFIPAFYFFVALTSSFQLLSPQVMYGYMYTASGSYSSDSKCILGMKDPPSSLICTPKDNDHCYIKCEERNYPTVFFTGFNLIPAIYMVCFLFIVFASLTFRIKRVNRRAVEEKLSRTLLTQEQQIDVKNRQETINEMKNELKNSLNMKYSEIKNTKKQISKAEEELQNYIIKLVKLQYQCMEAKIKQHSVKLNPKEKKFKEEYDTMMSQDYANNTFKVLAAVMSFISIVVMLVVSLAIAMNIFNSSFGLVNGFVQLDDWLRIYVIVMACMNFGSFILLLFFHLLFQPKLVWYIIISYWSYTIYQPIYNFILIIFSFCNIDDVTWGTKGISSETTSQIFYKGKVKFLVRWFSANAFLLMLLICGNIFTGKTPYLILIIGMYGTGYLAIKTFLAILNYIKYFVFDKWVARWRIRSARKKNDSKQQEIEKRFRDFLRKIESSKTKSQNEWGELYNKNNISSYDSIQKHHVVSSKSVSGYLVPKPS